MSALVSMVTMIFMLWCGECSSFSASRVSAEPRDAAGDALLPHTSLNRTPHALRYRADRYRDPFAPKSIVRKEAKSPVPQQEPDSQNVPVPAIIAPVPQQDPDNQNVLVKGIISSPRGRWALLEFANGERRIVVAGQVLAAFSRVVTRITDREVTLSALEGTVDARLQPDRTYVLDR